MKKINSNLDSSIEKKETDINHIRIRAACAEDESIWREMWENYNVFYGAKVPQDITTSTWNRIIDPKSSIKALIVLDDSGVIGFANYVLHSYTWSSGLACLMDDLFVVPEARGKGAGKLLIQKIIDMAKENEWTRVYWVTREGNDTARALYDKFCKVDGFVRYTINLDGICPSGGNSK